MGPLVRDRALRITINDTFPWAFDVSDCA
jgi:hypothetical protein